MTEHWIDMDESGRNKAKSVIFDQLHPECYDADKHFLAEWYLDELCTAFNALEREYINLVDVSSNG